jgi:hypothetical protein
MGVVIGQSRGVTVRCGALISTGAVLLLLALSPGRPSLLALTTVSLGTGASGNSCAPSASLSPITLWGKCSSPQTAGPLSTAAVASPGAAPANARYGSARSDAPSTLAVHRSQIRQKKDRLLKVRCTGKDAQSARMIINTDTSMPKERLRAASPTSYKVRSSIGR